MNYYERHIGDYLKDTAHLSLMEHGVYTRLLDVYYTREAPLPDEEVARLIGARSKDERQALSVVLQEYFELREGRWYQDRCDREIERYRHAEPERKQRKANTDTRLKRHRQERSALFEAIRAAGHHVEWNAPMPQLRSVAASLQIRLPETLPETLQPPFQETARNAAATATHTPYPSNQNTNTQDTHVGIPRVRAGAPPPVCVSAEKQVADAMRAAGMRSVDASHPAIRELLGRQATVAMFVDAAAMAQTKSKGPQYAFGIVRTRLADAAREAAGAPAPVVTVPSRQGPDPAIVKIDADAKLAAPMPPEVQAYRERLRRTPAGAAVGEG